MKISIVTPSLNSEKYIDQTIQSIISQKGDFEIEHLIVDGGSTDKTLLIAENFKENNKDPRISIIISSEKDGGMYEAINKGFAKATGDIYAWINSDDYYEEGAFEKIVKTFGKFPEIKWLKGVTSIIETDESERKGVCFIFNQNWIKRGLYGTYTYFITQDSVFWKKEVWENNGPINSKLRFAGDYDLWIKFSKNYPLWSLNAPVSNFRKRAGQLSEDMRGYRQEQKDIIKPKGFLSFMVKLFFWTKSKFGEKLEFLFLFSYPIIFPNHMKKYIEIEKSEPTIRHTRSYKI